MGVKVAINGYGTIGKRVADALSMQDDMEVVGVTKRRADYNSRLAKQHFPLYTAVPESLDEFREKGIEVDGTINDLLEECEIVIDCSPSKVGAENKPMYERAKVKAIFQGGEKHETAGTSFNAMANYEEALGKDYVRVVSCNTTGLCRTLYPLEQKFGIESVKAVMIRRAVDPSDSKKGPINAIEPVLKVPSHHGIDVQTVMHDLNITTMAVKVPTTLMHVHSVMVDLRADASSNEVISLWKETPRVAFVKGSEGINSTAQIIELARDLARKRNDFNESIVWEDGVHLFENTLYYYQAIHQESNVVPENIDAIRAMFELEEDKMKSIEKTDRALGLIKF